MGNERRYPVPVDVIWEECERMLDEVNFVLAADDQDVQAWIDLRYRGETEAVKPSRAKLLEELMLQNPEIFYEEIKQQYKIDQNGLAAAFSLCRARMLEEKDVAY